LNSQRTKSKYPKATIYALSQSLYRMGRSWVVYALKRVGLTDVKQNRQRRNQTLLSLLPGASPRILRRGFGACSMDFMRLGEENENSGRLSFVHGFFAETKKWCYQINQNSLL